MQRKWSTSGAVRWCCHTWSAPTPRTFERFGSGWPIAAYTMLPLEFFAGDDRRTERNGFERLFFSTASAFESWVGQMPKCNTLPECRLAFAWELHYSDAYQECLTVVDRILALEPNSVGVLTCKADTLVHLERLDEAFALAEKAIALDPCNPDAWETRCDVFEARDDWQGLLASCDGWQAAGKLSKLAQRSLH